MDTVQCTVSIPADKLQFIKQLCHSWATKSTCTKKELQSLLGSLLYVAKCIKYARVFLNRMLNLLRTNYNTKKIMIDDDFRKDLKWFYTFLPIFNGVTFFQYTTSKTVHFCNIQTVTGLFTIHQEGLWGNVQDLLGLCGLHALGLIPGECVQPVMFP